MDEHLNYGDYTKRFVTDIPADLNDERAIHYKSTIPRFPDEAVYIFSFEQGKMIYADGWKEVLGYRDDEITMLKIVTCTTPEYASFSQEINDKGLMFLHQETEDLEKYSFIIEVKKIHKNGSHVPLIQRVGVFKAVNGKLTEIIGRFQINRRITLGKIMRFDIFGPKKEEFEDFLSKLLFQQFAISGKEKEALALVAKGYAFKEIAFELNVSQSAIEKRIIPLYKRFGVKSLPQLISFAHENHILP
ncbi:MAG: LuxR C-terminal-related transcriptional regulator [Chitinophagaceae bacterium]|nr:LuxR C-terminal-related transcriptional regulator [Chitinophagaceae bacterium]